jgi:hypothetical protein
MNAKLPDGRHIDEASRDLVVCFSAEGRLAPVCLAAIEVLPISCEMQKLESVKRWGGAARPEHEHPACE